MYHIYTYGFYYNFYIINAYIYSRFDCLRCQQQKLNKFFYESSVGGDRTGKLRSNISYASPNIIVLTQTKRVSSQNITDAVQQKSLLYRLLGSLDFSYPTVLDFSARIGLSLLIQFQSHFPEVFRHLFTLPTKSQ